MAESRLETGVGCDFLSAFRDRNEVVHALEFLPMTDDTSAFLHFEEKMSGRKYDSNGVGWLSLDSILKKIGLRNPYRVNQWADDSRVYCSEILSAFDVYFKANGLPFDWGSLDVMDPHDVYDVLYESKLFTKITL